MGLAVTLILTFVLALVLAPFTMGGTLGLWVIFVLLYAVIRAGVSGGQTDTEKRALREEIEQLRNAKDTNTGGQE